MALHVKNEEGENIMDLMELLGPELGAQVQEKLGETKLIVDDGKMVPHSRLNEVLEQKKTLEAEISSRDVQLVDLKKAVEGNESLTATVKELQDANTAATAKYEADLKQITVDGFIGKEIAKLQPLDERLVLTLVDKDIIKMDGDKVLGLNEQLESLKTSHPYLFSEKKVTGKPPEKGLGEGALSKRAELIEQYDKAMDDGRVAEALGLQTKIRNMKE